MKKMIKMISNNQDFRLVLVDTQQVAKKQEYNKKFNSSLCDFFDQIITNFILLAALNDFNQKTSLLWHLTSDYSIFCEMSSSQFTFDYSTSFKQLNKPVFDLLNEHSTLSITIGDSTTGIHTGFVNTNITDVSLLFSHFAFQSEQLPSYFLVPKTNNFRGVVLQPLPYANENILSEISDELNYLSTAFVETDWQDVSRLFTHFAYVTSKKTLPGD